MSSVLVIGDVMLDVVVRPDGAVQTTSDTPSRVSVGRGGAAANLAVALARSGADVTFAGSAGDDAVRVVVEEALRRAGVTPRLQVTGESSGTVVAVIDPSTGQRAMLTDRGANSALAREFLIEMIAEGFDHVHVSGYTLLDESTRAAGVGALRAAHARGAGTSVDVCSVGPLRVVGPDVFRAAAEHATMLFANEEEALVLMGRDNIDDALADLAESFTEVVVTLGPRGAWAQRGDVVVAAPSEATVVVDTTGAGDATTGTYLGLRLRGANLDEALQKAMAAAAVVVAGGGSEGQARW